MSGDEVADNRMKSVVEM
ncbi:hypothetical protein CAJAP_09888 [Camponotus japonicus]